MTPCPLPAGPTEPRVAPVGLGACCEAGSPAPTAAVPQPASAASAGSAHTIVALRRSDFIQARLARASAVPSRYPERMPEEASAVGMRPHLRLLHGMRRPANWLQLVRFGL